MAKGNWGFQSRKPIEEPTNRCITITIRHFEDGSLSVDGPLNEPVYMLAALQNAIDAIRNHRNPNRRVIVPSKDVSVEPPGDT